MRKSLLLVFTVLLFPGALWAENRLSSNMGEVLLRNLQPGATYHLTSLLKFPLRINYEGSKPMQLFVTPSLPDATNELKEGYELLPSTGWVTTEPGFFELAGSTSIESNVSIALPDDPALRGRKFIIYVWAHTQGKGKGMSLGLGLKSRLLITVAKDPVAASITPAHSYMQFRLDPAVVTVSGVKPGKKAQLDKMLRRKFFIDNFGSEDRTFKIEPVSGKSLDMSVPPEMTWGPDGSQVQVPSKPVKAKARKKASFKVAVTVPDQPESYGKRYHYLVRVSPEGVGMASGILFRFNVETVEK